MPRRIPRPGRRGIVKGGAAAPKTIKVEPPKLDVNGLKAAYEWFPVDKKAAFRLAFEWFSNNLTTLLFGDPLDAARQKTYDRAVKCKQLGDDNTSEGEMMNGWMLAISLYEKVWPNANLPKLEDAMKNTELSTRVRNVQTVLSSLNGAFANQVRFGMTFGNDREYTEGEILLPAAEIDHMIPQTPLTTALAEVPTVAKVMSIVADDEGNQSLDGAKFMATLPILLRGVSAWAAGDRDLASKVIGKAAKVHAAAASTSNGTLRAASGPRNVVAKKGNITLLDPDRAKMPNLSGKRQASVVAALSAKTVAELKANLIAAGLPTYLGYALKTATEAGLIEVTQ